MNGIDSLKWIAEDLCFIFLGIDPLAYSSKPRHKFGPFSNIPCTPGLNILLKIELM
jgi:hypothetical protein